MFVGYKINRLKGAGVQGMGKKMLFMLVPSRTIDKNRSQFWKFIAFVKKINIVSLNPYAITLAQTFAAQAPKQAYNPAPC